MIVRISALSEFEKPLNDHTLEEWELDFQLPENAELLAHEFRDVICWHVGARFPSGGEIWIWAKCPPSEMQRMIDKWQLRERYARCPYERQKVYGPLPVWFMSQVEAVETFLYG